MGRQPKPPDEVLDTTILVRVRSADVEYWKEEAYQRRTTVSNLVRDAMRAHLGAAPKRTTRKRKV